MIALSEKGFKGYPSKLLEFSKKEHKGEEVLKINPRGQLPAFRDGDVVVNESYSIVSYLELTYPEQGTRLLPTDQAGRALVLQRYHEVQNLTTKMTDYYQAAMKKPEPDKDDVAAKKTALLEEFKIWDGYVAGGFVAGSSFSMADVAFLPQVIFPVRVGMKLEERFPNLHKYHEAMVKRESVQAAWPPHWRENPAPNMMGDFWNGP